MNAGTLVISALPGAVLAFFGYILLFRRARETADRDRTIEALTRRPLKAAVGDGVHAVTGRVQDAGATTLPFDPEQEAVFYELTVHGPRSAGGANNVLHTERVGETFLLRDESAEAVVQLRNARVYVAEHTLDVTRDVEPDTPLSDYLDSLQLRAPGEFVEHAVELRCHWLAPGDQVLVIGETSTEKRKGGAGYREGEADAPVFHTAPGFQLQVVGTSLEEYKRDQLAASRAMQRAGRGLIAVGALTVAAGLAIALS